jgi:opacity protein-like surface antigen
VNRPDEPDGNWDKGEITMKIFLAAAIAALVLVPAASAAQTPNKAYRTARSCLMQHGARFVGSSGNGGFVFFKGVTHVQYWRYHTWLGLVDKVTYYAFPGLPTQTKRDFISCIMKGN